MKRALIALAAMSCAGIAHGATDPAGDFLATFAGAPSPDLDFTSAEARFDGVNFNLSLGLAGPATGSPNVLHIWGINRGAGTARLNALSDPDLDPTVRWDALAVLLGDGTLRVVTFPQAGPPTITPIAGGAVINGAAITTAVPLALLPTRGFAPTSYTFQLWSRLRVNPALDGTNAEIADFGPRLFAAVPEPSSWAVLVVGFGLIGAAIRRPTSYAQA